MSDGLFSKLRRLLIRSLGGSHTNTFLGQVDAGVRCITVVEESLADDNGDLNAERLSVGRKAFGDALLKGLYWFILHWQYVCVFPGLSSFISRR